MAKKRYYWLKLKRDFFKRHDIQIIESMPNGKDYVLFYLKLLLESIDHEGQLRFSDTIPYNEQMIATITNTNIDIVRSAMKMFCELHMMEVLDDETIYMTEVKNMVGSETDWAKKKRLYREKQALLEDNARTKKDNVRQELEKEIELEIELDKEKDIERDVVVNAREKSLSKIINHYENTLKSFPAPATIPIIEHYLDHMDTDVVCEAITRAAENGKATWQYTKGILNNWKQKGVKTIENVKQEDVNFKQKKDQDKPRETDLQRRKRILEEQIREAEHGDDGGSEEISESDYKLLPGG